jgi:bromodomain-containing factor 1
MPVWDRRPETARAISVDYILRAINLIVRQEDSDAFLLPVDPVIDSTLDYRDKIAKPIDLEAMRNTGRTHKYSSFSEFLQDFDLLIRNAVTYNAPAQCRARRLQAYVRHLLHNIEANHFA